MNNIMSDVMHRIMQTPFIPLGLKPILWLDANDISTITESSGSVSQWDDKSGNNNHATQGTGSYQPSTGTSTVNSKNCLEFDGSDDYLDIPLFNLTDDFTMFMILNIDSLASRNMLLGLSSSDDNWLGSIETNGQSTANINGWKQGANFVAGVTSIITMSRTSNNFSIKLNGAENSWYETSAFNTDYLGRYKWNSYFLNGLICEVILLDKSLTTSEKLALETYLENKWGI